MCHQQNSTNATTPLVMTLFAIPKYGMTILRTELCYTKNGKSFQNDIVVVMVQNNITYLEKYLTINQSRCHAY